MAGATWYDPVVMPLALIVGVFLLGLVFRNLVLPRLLTAAKRSAWRWDDIFFASLKKILLLWALIVGCYLALPWAPLPSKTAAIIAKVLLGCSLASVTIWAAILLGEMVQAYADSIKGTFHSSSIFRNLAKGLILTIGALVILQTFGISITPILTALGVGGLAVALAVQEPLANFFAGLQILLSEQIRVGDYVRLASGEEGTVVDVTWRTTVIRAVANQLVVVPNAKLAAAIVNNYSLPGGEISVPVECAAAFDADLERVERASLEVAQEVLAGIQRGTPAPAPTVRFLTFGERGIGFVVTLYVRAYPDHQVIRHEFIKRLTARLRAEGIPIPYPTRTLLVPPAQALSRPDGDRP